MLSDVRLNRIGTARPTAPRRRFVVPHAAAALILALSPFSGCCHLACSSPVPEMLGCLSRTLDRCTCRTHCELDLWPSGCPTHYPHCIDPLDGPPDSSEPYDWQPANPEQPAREGVLPPPLPPEFENAPMPAESDKDSARLQRTPTTVRTWPGLQASPVRMSLPQVEAPRAAADRHAMTPASGERFLPPVEFLPPPAFVEPEPTQVPGAPE
jgi:hypothetical protein